MAEYIVAIDVTRVRFLADAGAPFEREVSQTMHTDEEWSSFWRSRSLSSRRRSKRSGDPRTLCAHFPQHLTLGPHLRLLGTKPWTPRRCNWRHPDPDVRQSAPKRTDLRTCWKRKRRQCLILSLTPQSCKSHSISFLIVPERCQHPPCPLDTIEMPGLLRALNPGPLAH